MEEKPAQSLFERLGGYEVIAAIIDDLYARMEADPSLQRFRKGRTPESLSRERLLFVDQICALSGGPCLYTGRDMKTAHAGMGITGSEWGQTMGYTAASLDKLKIPAKEKAEFLAIFERFRGEIIEENRR